MKLYCLTLLLLHTHNNVFVYFIFHLVLQPNIQLEIIVTQCLEIQFPVPNLLALATNELLVDINESMLRRSLRVVAVL